MILKHLHREALCLQASLPSILVIRLRTAWLAHLIHLKNGIVKKFLSNDQPCARDANSPQDSLFYHVNFAWVAVETLEKIQDWLPKRMYRTLEQNIIIEWAQFIF